MDHKIAEVPDAKDRKSGSVVIDNRDGRVTDWRTTSVIAINGTRPTLSFFGNPLKRFRFKKENMDKLFGAYNCRPSLPYVYTFHICHKTLDVKEIRIQQFGQENWFLTEMGSMMSLVGGNDTKYPDFSSSSWEPRQWHEVYFWNPRMLIWVSATPLNVDIYVGLEHRS